MKCFPTHGQPGLSCRSTGLWVEEFLCLRISDLSCRSLIREWEVYILCVNIYILGARSCSHSGWECILNVVGGELGRVGDWTATGLKARYLNLWWFVPGVTPCVFSWIPRWCLKRGWRSLIVYILCFDWVCLRRVIIGFMCCGVLLIDVVSAHVILISLMH